MSWRRLHAVDLNGTRGMTFFFLSGQLVGVHVHRSCGSCAMDTYERLSSRRRRSVVWIYMPIAPEDRVLVLGARKTDLGFNILVSSKLNHRGAA
jgi:hypothetical protein